MNTESPNNSKFGLPKPDFQCVSKKRSIWPIIIPVMLMTLVATVKIFYHIFFEISNQPHITFVPPITADDDPIVDQKTQKHTSSSFTAEETKEIEVGTNVNVEVNEALSGKGSFENKKNAQTKENIGAVANQLDKGSKNPKTLVKPGTYQELREPQGIYHLVVMSHLDKRSAMKAVQQLMKKNMGVCLILPRKGEKYYRVTIAHSKTQYEADERLKQFKTEYKNSFILKY
ncbi:SPOR domain-containing protein [Candidatus Cardinium hertigii]|jgi:hypothetical protein|uniref:SPOR domain-containing protein n=1 Tax=Candidatus Cardinium hertigii TaxID=247481 RepID=A0A3N2QAX9_9BACT|nr:SPOR domain-containing protein [Candidatus Cardinium hertigii]ROT46953.1 SPOR domain-containing protein [Candidatus Cardinium hertigii]